MNRFTFMLQYEALKDLYKYVSTAEKLAVMEFYGHSIHQCSIAIAMSLKWLEEQGIIAIEGPLSKRLKNQELLKIFNEDTLDKMLKTVELSDAFCMEYREPDIEELSESVNTLEETCHCLVECIHERNTKLDSVIMDNKEFEVNGKDEILPVKDACVEEQSALSKKEKINAVELVEENADEDIIANCDNMYLANIEEESKISNEGFINALSEDKAIEKECMPKLDTSDLEVDNIIDIECIDQQSTQCSDNIEENSKEDIINAVDFKAANPVVECEITEINEGNVEDNSKTEVSVDIIPKIETYDIMEVIGQESKDSSDIASDNDRVEKMVAENVSEKEDVNGIKTIVENNKVLEKDVDSIRENSCKVINSNKKVEQKKLCVDENFDINKKNMLAIEPFWRIIAKNGDIDAINNLGDICYFLKKNKKKYIEAATWYRISANKGDSYALLQLKNCYAKEQNDSNDGENKKVEFKNILFAYIKTQREEVLSQDGTGVWSDYKDMLGLNSSDMVKLDVFRRKLILRHSQILKSYFIETIKKYEILAREGDVDTQLLLGDCFFYGAGVEKDCKKTTYWYKKAIALGNTDALRMYSLAFMLDNREYREYKTCFDMSKPLWELLSEEGDVESSNNLGDYYFYLNGDSNCRASVSWYEISAKKGDCYALLQLSRFYEHGFCVAQSTEKKEKLQRDLVFKYCKLIKSNEKYKNSVPSIDRIMSILENSKSVSEKIQNIYLYQASKHAQYVEENIDKIVQDIMVSNSWNDKDQQFLLGECNYLGVGMPKNVEEGVKRYEKAAGQGELNAQLCLGNHYFYLDANHKFLKKAMGYYKLPAESGMLEAQYMLGKCYEICDAEDITFKNAIEWYEKAANQGNESATNAIAGIVKKWCTQGDEALKNFDYNKALKLYRLAKERGSFEAYSQLAECFYRNPSLAKDKGEIHSCYKDAARHGDVKFQYYLGKYYYNTKNYYKALEWFELSADQNYMDSLEKAVECCIEQENINQPIGNAWKFYKKAAEAGIPLAMYHWALCCEKGIGVEVDIHEALEWYTKALNLGVSEAKQSIEALNEKIRYEELLVKAVDEGQTDAQYEVGKRLELGLGVVADTKEAIEYYTLAADQGNVKAQIRLGNIYEKGELVQKNLHKAVALYKLAAEQDENCEKHIILCEAKLKYELLFEKVEKGAVPEDVYQLALCYEFGNGTEKNIAKAVSYYRELAKKDFLKAQFKLGVIYKLGNGVERSKIKALEYFGEVAKKDLSLVKEQIEEVFKTWSREHENNAKILDKDYILWLGKFSRFDLTYVKFKLGKYYFERSQEYDKAFPLFLDSSSTGYNGPLRYLAYCYERGLGTVVNYSKAVRIYMELVNKGDTFAEGQLSICYPKLQMLHECEEVLKKGDMYDSYNLARICEGMTNLYRNKEYAILLYEKAAEFGYKRAQIRLGIVYERGELIERNLEKALNLFNTAYKNGAVDALDFIETCQQEMYFMEMLKKCENESCSKNQYALGLCYENGNGVNKDSVKALKYYKKAADLGLGKALHKLGLCYENGIGTAVDEECALDSYTEAICKGEDTARIDKKRLLRNLFEKGVKACEWHNYTEGRSYLTTAAEYGYVQAQSALGSFYATGAYWEKNIGEAVKWLEKAYAQGSDEAAIILGSYYMTGTGVVKDKVKGIEMVKRAADSGLPYAQDYLGNCYFHGDGVPKDYAKAFTWHMKAAEKGFAEAQNNVAGCYSMGYGVEKDLKKAFDWNMKSANQNFAEGQYAVGVSYFYGNGVKKDLEKADYWLLRAAENGHEGAKIFAFKAWIDMKKDSVNFML